MTSPILELLPAVDVAEGKAVRLTQGELGTETNYGDPVDAAGDWAAQGAEWIHLVDLDAAFGAGGGLSGGAADDDAATAGGDLVARDAALAQELAARRVFDLRAPSAEAAARWMAALRGRRADGRPVGAELAPRPLKLRSLLRELISAGPAASADAGPTPVSAATAAVAAGDRGQRAAAPNPLTPMSIRRTRTF